MGIKLKLDINGISQILAGGNTREKMEGLKELGNQLPEWDIFPTHILITGLDDREAEVRAKTLALLSNNPEGLSQPNMLRILSLIEDCDEEVRCQVVETINVCAFHINRETAVTALPCLWHPSASVRQSASDVFYLLSSLLTEEMFFAIAEVCCTANVEVRKSLANFLEQNGQGHLIQN